MPTAKYCQSYAFCRNALQTTVAQSKGTPLCVVGRAEGRIVFIWPLAVYKRSLWRLMKPLGPEVPSPVAPLMEDGCGHHLDDAWTLLKARGGADIVSLDYIAVDSALHRVLARDRGMLIDARPDVAPYAVVRDTDWARYLGSLSQSHRKKHANMQRRLAKEGKVAFEVVQAGDARCGALIAALLAQKRRWADKVNKRGDWLYRRSYEAWLTACFAEPSPTERYVMFVLRLDGMPVAIKIAAICKSHVDLIIAGYDAAYERFSPGLRLDEHWVRWAVESRLDIDFGLGGEHYKIFWTNGNSVPTLSCNVPISRWGRLGVMILRLKRTIAERRR